MRKIYIPLALTLAGLAGLLVPARLLADRETNTVENAGDVLASLCAIPERAIPPALIQDAQGLAIIPNLIKAGFVVGGRFGRGIIVLREPDGSWSNPIFVTMTGGSVGWQVGVQSTDVVLVFKTRSSLERIIKGKNKLTLGADVGIAAGPIGRQAEAGTDGMLRAEIYSYSRSRGLFVGVALEGAGIINDYEANEAFYRIRGGYPADVLNFRGPVPLPIQKLRMDLARLSPLPGPPVEFRAQPVIPGPPPLLPPMPLPPPQVVPPQPPAVPPPSPSPVGPPR